MSILVFVSIISVQLVSNGSSISVRGYQNRLKTHFNPAEQVELADSLSTAFLVLLEKLSPTERAVSLLREVFDFNYAEIEKIVGKSAINCRQILRRSRQHLASRQGDNLLLLTTPTVVYTVQ